MGEGTDSPLPTVNSAGVCGRKNTKLIFRQHILSSDPQYDDKDYVRTRWLLAILREKAVEVGTLPRGH